MRAYVPSCTGCTQILLQQLAGWKENVAIGDEVCIPPFVGSEIMVDGEWLVLLSREQVYGLVA